MRLAAILCSCLVIASPLSAQYLTEWRPSIAEDNRAATWEDTSLFLKNSLLVPSPPFIERSEVYDVDVANRCFISYNTVSALQRTHFTLSVKDLDPLSIVVRTGRNADPSKTMSIIIMEGTSKATFANLEEIKRVGKGNNLKMEGALDFMKTFQCADSDKTCEVAHRSLSKLQMFAGNQEDSKRFARALMHAALLCGGTKAVSPF